MAEDKYKKILAENRNLLINNIIIDDKFMNLLREKKVITASMLKDLDLVEEREEKLLQLLQNVARLGKNSFYAFGDVLSLT